MVTVNVRAVISPLGIASIAILFVVMNAIAQASYQNGKDDLAVVIATTSKYGNMSEWQLNVLAKEMADRKKAVKSIRPKASSVHRQGPEHKPVADKAMGVSLMEHESRKTKSPGSLPRKSSSGVKSIDSAKEMADQTKSAHSEQPSPGPADVTTPKKPISTSTSTSRFESPGPHGTTANREVINMIDIGEDKGADESKKVADQKKAVKSIRPKSSFFRHRLTEQKPGADHAMAVSLKGADRVINISSKEQKSSMILAIVIAVVIVGLIVLGIVTCECCGKSKPEHPPPLPSAPIPLPDSLSRPEKLKQAYDRTTKSSSPRKSSSGVKSIRAGENAVNNVKAEKCAVGKRGKEKSVVVAKKGSGK